ncbi:GNAT family N-acetyltransferase [Sutcliffiella horikoshii]|uniref:GNAT family N-acetyltransferase n=1 Tax=Sutcliffiella horikoshii TaxID=79883 RepID=UPI003CED1895
MALDLWPESTEEELHESFHEIMASSWDKILFYRIGNEFVSFIHLSIRVDYVEGTESSPTGYIEGVYVKPEFRRKGYSAKLVEAGRSRGRMVKKERLQANRFGHPFGQPC